MKYNLLDCGTQGEIPFNTSMEYIHQLLHQGCMYNIYYEDLDMDTNDEVFGLLRTGDKHAHIAFEAEATGQVNVRLFKTPTIASDGTPYSITNYRDDIATEAGLKVYIGTTVTTSGTLRLNKTTKGHTQGNSKVPGSVRSGIERILPPNTDYLLYAKCLTDNALFSFEAAFYEEDL